MDKDSDEDRKTQSKVRDRYVEPEIIFGEINGPLCRNGNFVTIVDGETKIHGFFFALPRKRISTSYEKYLTLHKKIYHFISFDEFLFISLSSLKIELAFFAYKG